MPTTGFTVSPQRGSVLQAITLPQSGALMEASNFRGDGGLSFVQGLAAGTNAVSGLTKAVDTIADQLDPVKKVQRELALAEMKDRQEMAPDLRALAKADLAQKMQELEYNKQFFNPTPIAAPAPAAPPEKIDPALAGIPNLPKSPVLRDAISALSKVARPDITVDVPQEIGALSSVQGPSAAKPKPDIGATIKARQTELLPLVQKALYAKAHKLNPTVEMIQAEDEYEANKKHLQTFNPYKQADDISTHALNKATDNLMAGGRYRAGMTADEIMAEVGNSKVYSKEQLDSANKLRDDFNNDKTVAKAVAAEGALQVILKGLSEGNGPGDIAAINQFQSGMVDPGATVREGDVALMKQASPLMSRLQNYLPQLIKGGQLPPEMREQIKSLATGIYKERAAHANEKSIPQYERLAKKSSLDFEDVGRVFDLPSSPDAAGNVQKTVPLTDAQRASMIKAPKLGDTISQQGVTFKFDGTRWKSVK